MRKLYLLTLFLIILLTACSNSPKERYEHYEAFISDAIKEPNSKYKKINSITITESSEYELYTEVHLIEDYYSNDDIYQKTVITSETRRENKLTKYVESDINSTEHYKPLTILFPDNINNPLQYIPNLSEDDQERIKQHVNKIVNEYLN